MKTVAQATREVLQLHPFYEETIIEGVSNNSNIARKLKSEIEEVLYEKVSLPSVVMALNRITKKDLHGKGKPPLLKRVKEVRVVSSLTRFVFKNERKSDDLRREKLVSIPRETGDFLYVARGTLDSLVVTDSTHEEKVKKILKGSENLSILNNLSAVTLKMPPESFKVPGVFYPIIRALALDYVSFVEIFSISSELILLFQDSDIERAFTTIKKVLSS